MRFSGDRIQVFGRVLPRKERALYELSQECAANGGAGLEYTQLERLDEAKPMRKTPIALCVSTNEAAFS